MKFGANTWIWLSPFSAESLHLIQKIAEFGFDVVEIPIDNINLIDFKKTRLAIKRAGLECSICGAFGPNRDIISEHESIRINGQKYIKDCIRACAELGSHIFAGPVYSAVGKACLISKKQKKYEWDLCVQTLKGLGDFAEYNDVTICVEPLNRFETSFINLVDDVVWLVREVGSPSVKIHLDTFHMNIEEKNMESAIKKAGKDLYHFHACENDRGIPGSGNIDWNGIARGLKDINYDNYIVIESFSPGVKEISKAAAIWRPLAKTQDSIAKEGLEFLKKLLS